MIREETLRFVLIPIKLIILMSHESIIYRNSKQLNQDEHEETC